MLTKALTLLMSMLLCEDRGCLWGDLVIDIYLFKVLLTGKYLTIVAIIGSICSDNKVFLKSLKIHFIMHNHHSKK